MIETQSRSSQETLCRPASLSHTLHPACAPEALSQEMGASSDACLMLVKLIFHNSLGSFTWWVSFPCQEPRECGIWSTQTQIPSPRVYFSHRTFLLLRVSILKNVIQKKKKKKPILCHMRAGGFEEKCLLSFFLLNLNPLET